jgi:hypothetical protein
MPHAPAGNGLGSWPSRSRHQPLVARLDPVTARRLGVSVDQLRQAAAGLEVWGEHASGEPVYRWRDLLRALGQLPDSTETASHRGGRATRRRVEAATTTAPRPAP